MRNTISFILLSLCAVSHLHASDITLTVLYDNTAFDERLAPDWGFSCLVKVLDRTVLFDTGTNPQILAQNATLLNVDWSTIDDIVISHHHLDHTGGLDTVLALKTQSRVWFPQEFPDAFAKSVKERGGIPVLVGGPANLIDHVHLTGNLGTDIVEQALYLDTDKGVVVITGCSHPGIVHMVKSVKEMSGKPIYMVLGGFHLLRYDDTALDKIITQLKALGVQKCGATHCTGEHAIQKFKDAFGADFIDLGAGRVLFIQMD